MGKSALGGMAKGLQRLSVGGAKYTNAVASKKGGAAEKMAKWGRGK
jgi:hypothetical protein